eukprot:scaffold43322_cov28-Tisochrysis_lutea.AAC.4
MTSSPPWLLALGSTHSQSPFFRRSSFCALMRAAPLLPYGAIHSDPPSLTTSSSAFHAARSRLA